MLAGVVRWFVILLGGAVVVNAVLALFERFAPPRAVKFFMKNIGNPMFRGYSRFAPGWAVIEVTGRKSGRHHRVNVGGRVIEKSLWILARSGADYVRNLKANPRVRVCLHGRWRKGVAHVVSEDNPRGRLFNLNPINGVFLWLVGAELTTIRIDLDTHA